MDGRLMPALGRRWPRSDVIRRSSPISSTARRCSPLTCTHGDRIALRSRLGHLRSCAPGAGPRLRRRVFHGCADNPRLLPSGLPCTTCAVQECSILCHGSRGRARGLPAVSALQTRNGAGEPGLERDGYHRCPGNAADFRRGFSMKLRSRISPIVSGSERATCCGYFFTMRARPPARSPRLGVYKRRNGWSTRRRCRCRRLPSPPGSAASGGSTTPFARHMRAHHRRFAGRGSEPLQPKAARCTSSISASARLSANGIVAD